MIKTTTLALLALRYLRSNRRASVSMALAQALVHARLWTKRRSIDWNDWKRRLPAFLVFFRVALGPGIILFGVFFPHGVVLVSCSGLPYCQIFLTAGWHGAGMLTPKHFGVGTREQTHSFIFACLWWRCCVIPLLLNAAGFC